MGKRQLIKYIYPKNKENKNKLGLILIKKNLRKNFVLKIILSKNMKIVL
jgi:CHASE1-domain containing sensor protein